MEKDETKLSTSLGMAFTNTPCCPISILPQCISGFSYRMYGCQLESGLVTYLKDFTYSPRSKQITGEITEHDNIILLLNSFLCQNTFLNTFLSLVSGNLQPKGSGTFSVSRAIKIMDYSMPNKGFIIIINKFLGRQVFIGTQK